MYGLIASKSVLRRVPRIIYSNSIVRPRFQSQTHYRDVELQKIIETTNFGSEARKKKEKEHRDQRDLEERIRLEHHKLEKKDGKVDTPRVIDGEVKGTKDLESQPPYTDDVTEAPDGRWENFETSPIASSEKRLDFQLQPKTKIDRLPSNLEKQRSHLSDTLDTYAKSIQATIFTASTTINNITGYTGIERLKNSVDGLEQELKLAKKTVKLAKAQYTEAILQRSKLQREINELLTRKHNWSPNDLERFTLLYRNDHANEQQESHTQSELNEAELAVDAIQLKLTQLILTRYHEEQIWSDKIRKVSTWGTWLLMGINVFLFFIATFFVEPWKRKRLVGSFEDKVKQVLFEVSEGRAMERQVLNKLQISSERSIATQPPEKRATPLTFNVFGKSWDGIRTTLTQAYGTLISTNIDSIHVNKNEFALVTTVVGLTGAALGCFVTLLFK